MPTLTIGQPNERQKIFLTADKKNIAFGGAQQEGAEKVGQSELKQLCFASNIRVSNV